MSSKRNQTIAIARFLMYKYGLNQQLEGMTDEEYLAHPIGLIVGTKKRGLEVPKALPKKSCRNL